MAARHVALVVALAAFLTAACGDGGPAPQGDVSISGAVVAPDGQPQAGAVVVVASEAELGQATAFTCLYSMVTPPAACGVAKVITGPDGAFSFTVPRGNGWHQLATGNGDGGPTVGARFRPAADVRIPSLRLWAPKVELTVGRTVRAAWEPRDPAAEERVVFMGAGGSAVWIAGGRGSIANDGRVLEDARGTAVVESIGESDLDDGTVRLTYRSAPIPFTGTTGAAPSRNRPCVPAPCVLTDGDLTSAATHEAPNQFAVDLERSTTVRLIVVRGCPGRCSVETSVDGLTWRIVGSGDEPFFSVTPAVGPDVRHVKVRSPNPLTSLAEVAAW